MKCIKSAKYLIPDADRIEPLAVFPFHRLFPCIDTFPLVVSVENDARDEFVRANQSLGSAVIVERKPLFLGEHNTRSHDLG